jgi:uncharacterized protein YjbJ (UPF0337 family)
MCHASGGTNTRGDPATDSAVAGSLGDQGRGVGRSPPEWGGVYANGRVSRLGGRRLASLGDLSEPSVANRGATEPTSAHNPRLPAQTEGQDRCEQKEGCQMPKGTGDRAEGRLDQLKGKVKEVVGRKTKNQSQRNEGIAQQSKGQGKEAWGDVKDAGEKVKRAGKDITK